MAFGTGAGLTTAALVLAAVVLHPGASRRGEKSAGQAKPEVPTVGVTS